MGWIVELQKNVWLAQGLGDPPRSLVKEYARHYPNESTAKKALERVRRTYPRKGYINAEIYLLKKGSR